MLLVYGRRRLIILLCVDVLILMFAASATGQVLLVFGSRQLMPKEVETTQQSMRIYGSLL